MYLLNITHHSWLLNPVAALTLNPACQAYARALELAPGRLYCLIQCGTIRAALGAYREGLADFEGALAVDPGHPAALLGAAEALVAQARLDVQRGALGEGGRERGSGVCGCLIFDVAAHCGCWCRWCLCSLAFMLWGGRGKCP